MKKIIYLTFIAIFAFNVVNAQEEIQQALDANVMPTDEQIWQTIEQFGIDESQKEQVFQATKKQIEEMFRTKKVPEIYQNMNVDAIKDLSSQEENSAPVTTQPSQVSERRHIKHDPIFVKQRYGPKR